MSEESGVVGEQSEQRSDQHPLEILLEKQRDMEDHAVALGGDRFRARLQKANEAGKASTMGAAKKLVQEAIDPLSQAIQEMLTKSQRGRKHFAVKWCSMLGADVAAFLTVRVLMDMVGKHKDRAQMVVRRCALEITGLMEDELKYRRFKEKEPGLFEYKISKFNTSSYAHMARAMDATIRYADIDVSDLEMTPTERLLVGTKLIDLCISATGLFATESVRTNVKRGKVRTDVLLMPTEETLNWLTERNAVLELLWPVNIPMVVPPLPWAPGQAGGYRFALRGKHALVRGVSKAHQKAIRDTTMPVVYEALNRIQETPWRINRSVLELVEAIAERGGGLAGIPKMQDQETPPKPADIGTDLQVREKWRKMSHAVHEANHTRRMKALEFTRVVATAKSVMQEAAVWFPCNLDFRGRIYPVVSYLHPQGDDLSKSLLTFAQGKPLGQDGAGWLALHGANCLGETPDGVKLSRQTLQERVDWIVGHTTEIEGVAADPFTHDWWAGADDPLQFYAFCVEWAGFARMEREGLGGEYVCTLPCSQDGSCNGLQHFSAMLLDEVGGTAVNVLPTERPNDIYQRVADSVLEKLEQSSDELATLWLRSGLVTRKLTKRPTMTFGYGSKQFGFKSQILEYLQGLENWREIKALFSKGVGEHAKSVIRPACAFMAKLIWESLGDIVVAASQGMEWMQAAARLVVKTGSCVSWGVPGTNFLVRQGYFKSTDRKVNTILAGKVFQPRFYEQTSVPDAVKQSNAVAPNFVHSLDAAALMLTVRMAAGEGVENFAMVHDSYGTLAADCPLLAGCTRQAFFGLYTQNDVVGALHQQLSAMAAPDAQFPAPPPKGRMDLSTVLQSDYFFS